MKAKLIVVIGAVLVSALFVGNLVLGNSLAVKLKNQLELSLNKGDSPKNVSIEEVSVSPLFSKIKLKGLKVVDQQHQQALSSPLIEVDMPYQEALRLANSKKVEEIKSFRLKVHDLELLSIPSNNRITIDESVVDFDGHLTRADINQLDQHFPSKKQHITVSVNDLKLTACELYTYLGISQDQLQQWSTLTQGAFSIEFLPNKKELVFKDVVLKSSLFTYQSAGLWKYSGDGFKQAKLTVVDADTEFKLLPDKLEWGRADKTGRFSLAKMEGSFKGNMEYDSHKKMIGTRSDNEFSFAMDDLSVRYAGRKKAEMDTRSILLGVSLNEIVIYKLRLNSKIKNDELIIKDTRLESSLLNASLEGVVKLNPLNLNFSQIKNAKLLIDIHDSGLEGRVSTIEMMMGRALPREGNTIALQIYGSLNKPKVHGLPF
ncbi:MAG: hypothetical protein JEZ14_22190 [Marinilabiliaceae bacterium]|nr:hypothetical protein [Marinilabiliaceae bacterium]